MTEAEQFKNSTLLLALQPFKIDREDHFYNTDKKRKNLQEKHMFEKLKEIMREYELKYVMRTTTEINSFAEITVSISVKNQIGTYTRTNLARSVPII